MSDLLELCWVTAFILGLLGLGASYFASHDPRWKRQSRLELEAEAGEHGRDRARDRHRRQAPSGRVC